MVRTMRPRGVAVSNWEPGTDGDPRRWLTLGVLCLSLLMVVVGNTVLNIALPTLARELDASDTSLQWMVDAYGLVFAGLLFTGGALGDRFGRKGLLNIGLVVFGSGSLLAALSTSAGQIVAGRAVMGVGAALVMPSTLSILTNVFPPHERARAIGTWAGVAGAGGAIGPITSGLLLERWWGAIFLINLPLIALALVAGAMLVPTSRDPSHARLDLLGAALSILAIGSLVYGIIEAPQHGWTDPSTLIAFFLAALFGICFAAWELYTEAPMLDLRYFGRRGFSGGSLAISMMFFGMFGMFFLLTQYLQLVHGWSALEAGVRTLPFAFTIMVVAPLSSSATDRFGTKWVVASGVTVAGIGMLALSRAGVVTDYGYIAAALVVLAAGMGLTMAPSTTAIMSSLPLAKSGVGSAMNDTNRELGGAIGVAVLGSIFATHYRSAIESAMSGLPADMTDAASQSLYAALGLAEKLGRPELAEAAKVAYTDAMSIALTVGALVAFAAAVIVAVVLPRRVASSEAQPRYGAHEVENGADPEPV
jgi:EmrB/QacA subfamily drug resistance transporter